MLFRPMAIRVTGRRQPPDSAESSRFLGVIRGLTPLTRPRNRLQPPLLGRDSPVAFDLGIDPTLQFLAGQARD
jgi:hypothetical protein